MTHGIRGLAAREESVGKLFWSQSFHFHSKQWLLERKEVGGGWSWREEKEAGSGRRARER